MTLSHAAVAPLLMPDYPTRMSISATMCLSPSCPHLPCYLQDRDEIADDVIIAISPGTPKPLCESHRNLGTSPHGAIRHKPTSYGRIHTSAFSGIRASIHTRFALSHAYGIGILHYQKQHFNFIQGSLPTFQLNATVRGVFMPDSTLDFLPIFSSKKCAKASIFSRFLHSLQWFGPRKSPRCFQA